MRPAGPHLTIEIRSPRAHEVDKVSGDEIRTLFSRADYLVAQACQESVFWKVSSGAQHELRPAQLIRVSHEPAPTSVLVHLSVPGHALSEEVGPEAQRALAQMKRRWSTRVKILFARLLGADLRAADQENLDQITSDIQEMVSGWVLHTLGYRLSLLLENPGVGSGADKAF